jgi:hypothetical protein
MRDRVRNNVDTLEHAIEAGVDPERAWLLSGKTMGFVGILELGTTGARSSIHGRRGAFV